jgi:imidazolonepropionase-like amidohydrolase
MSARGHQEWRRRGVAPYRARMRPSTLLRFIVPALLSAFPAGAQTVTFRGATLWDGSGAPPVHDGTLVVRDGRVVSAGRVSVPDGSAVVDLDGRWIVPGLVNAHGHVTGAWADDGVEGDERRMLGDLLLYARYGVTTVNSLGDEPAVAGRIRRDQDRPAPGRARLHWAGTVIYETTPDAARAAVRAGASLEPDWIKIRVDDNLGTTAKMPWPAIRAVIEEAHARGLRVATHLYYLDDAKRLLRAGTDLVAHSVRDAPVDDELVTLLRERGVCYVPTLMREVSTFVYAERPTFFDADFFTRLAKVSEVQRLSRPSYQEEVRSSASAASYRQALAQAKDNLDVLARSGVKIAMGTDSGPAGRFPGYFEHLELELMVDAGLTPEAALLSATRDAASCLSLPDVGTLEPGRWADFLVLTGDPLADIGNTQRLQAVYVGGAEIR